MALRSNRGVGIKVPGSSLVRHALFSLSFSPSYLLFLLLLLFFYHSYHKNNCLSRKDESFFNNRGQNIVTEYDRDINKTNKTRHKDSTNEPSLNETRNVNLSSSNVLDLRLFFPY